MMTDGSEAANNEAAVTILARHNGPFVVEGPFRLIDADGNEFPVVAGKKVSLCRCGASTRKPFCDGTHSNIGFDAAERAVRELEEGKEQG
jgi:CDGSH-type Zn-finger protein